MPLTMPGTFDNVSRCSYDELCAEARAGIDAVVNSHTLGMRMPESIALMLLRFIGMDDDEAADLLTSAREEASQH
jgi:hypothetical protein